MLTRQNLVSALAVLCTVLAAYFIYLPGINGTFLLDDPSTLTGLAHVGDSGNFDGILRYIFTDGTGYLTRPLAKLSFLVDAVTWPTEPSPFKRTNILIHIVNGLLVMWLVLQLAASLRMQPKSARVLAICTGSLWLLHPLNVSTTLYIVQRMTLLASFFMLAGLVAYTAGRRMLSTRPLKGYLLISVGTGAGVVLGFLCKEIAILLPLYILVLEFCLLRSLSAPRGWVLWQSVFIYLPILFIVGWHLYTQLPPAEPYAGRPFTLSERLLTESRVMVDYIRLILLPTRGGTGVFHDDFILSHGWLEPTTTLPSLIVLFGLMFSALYFRRRQPVYAFAVLWFFAGHALESGFIPLELYFEHRNYLPMLGPLLAVVHYTVTAAGRLSKILRPALAAYIALAVFGTWQNVQIWGDRVQSTLVWEREHPASVRATEYALNSWLRVARYDEAKARVDKISKLQPAWTAPRLEKIYIACLSGDTPADFSMDNLVAELAETQWDTATYDILFLMLERIENTPCDIIEHEDLIRIIDTLADNPSFRRRRPTVSGLYVLQSRSYKNLNDPANQARALGKAFAWNNNWSIAVKESIVRASLGEYELALKAMRRARQLYSVNLKHIKFEYDSDELSAWEHQLNVLIKQRDQNAGNEQSE